MTTKTAREQRELARAIIAMAGRLSASAHKAGLAYKAPGGSLMGKTHEQWSAAADRQFRAVQRLTMATVAE
jgi:hypothetical protein